MKQKIDHTDPLLQFLLHFIFSGSSALILSIAYIYTDIWFVYIFALLPFLLRVINTDFKGSVINGVFLTLGLVFVTLSGEILKAPVSYTCNILLICFTFTALSVIINRLRRYFALSFLLFIVLCFPLEYFHKSYFEFNAIFKTLRNDAGFLFRAVSLFGFIFISFLIIAVNSLLLLLIGLLRRRVVSGHFYLAIEKSHFGCWVDDIALIKHGECLPNLRGPPIYF